MKYVQVECDTQCITFTLTGCEDPCGDIDSFAFAYYNNQVPIVDGETYLISDLPNNFYIDALISGDSESLRYEVLNLDTNEVVTITENYLPYTYPGGENAWNLGTGNFQITASLFDGNYCSSTLCDVSVITFTLVDEVIIGCLVQLGEYNSIG